MNGISDQNIFLLEIAKETSRANRFTPPRSFALVLLHFASPLEENPRISELIEALRKSCRISDTIGWFDGHVSLLLPETERDGAFHVANKLSLLGRELEMPFETEVRTYPEDEDITAVSDALNQNRGDESQAPEFQDEDSDEFHDQLEEKLAHQVLNESEMLKQQAVEFSSDSDVLRCGLSGSIPTPVWKRAVDVLLAGTGLIVLAPLFLLVAIAIKLSSKGPVFFQQVREGKDGAHFGIWKFRTMRHDAESNKAELRAISEQDGPAFKIENDPRITRIGRYLRKSCVDELPQLLNVLKGEMSLVGPRPLPIDESAMCKVWQRYRLRVLPGLTCIWQVDGGRDTKFDDWMRMDLEYLKRRSFWFDVKLIFRTALVALMHKGSV